MIQRTGASGGPSRICRAVAHRDRATLSPADDTSSCKRTWRSGPAPAVTRRSSSAYLHRGITPLQTPSCWRGARDLPVSARGSACQGATARRAEGKRRDPAVDMASRLVRKEDRGKLRCPSQHDPELEAVSPQRNVHKAEDIAGGKSWNTLPEGAQRLVHEIRAFARSDAFGTRTAADYIMRSDIRSRGAPAGRSRPSIYTRRTLIQSSAAGTSQPM